MKTVHFPRHIKKNVQIALVKNNNYVFNMPYSSALISSIALFYAVFYLASP